LIHDKHNDNLVSHLRQHVNISNRYKQFRIWMDKTTEVGVNIRSNRQTFRYLPQIRKEKRQNNLGFGSNEVRDKKQERKVNYKTPSNLIRFYENCHSGLDPESITQVSTQNQRF